MLTEYPKKKMNKHLEHDFHLLIIQTDFVHFLNYGVDVKLTTVLEQETVKDI